MQAKTKRRSAGEWAALVENQEQSRQTIKDFCKNQGLSTATFMYWRKKLYTPPLPPGSFVAVKPAAAPVPGLILRGRQGVEIEVPAGTSLPILHTLIAALSC